MVNEEDVLHLYHLLLQNGIQIWLTGGWGIDALLGEHTRPHKDLDALLQLDDMLPMRQILKQDGYHLKELWSENTWVKDRHGNRMATAFVLQDGAGREFDAHALQFDDAGNGIPTWKNSPGFFFRKADLAGRGTIAGIPVRCISPAMQARCHTGYDLPVQQLEDLKLLRVKYNV